MEPGARVWVHLDCQSLGLHCRLVKGESRRCPEVVGPLVLYHQCAGVTNPLLSCCGKLGWIRWCGLADAVALVQW